MRSDLGGLQPCVRLVGEVHNNDMDIQAGGG
jgi:hypothetical protein